MKRPSYWDDLSLTEKLMYQQLLSAGYGARVGIKTGAIRVDIKRGWFTVASCTDPLLSRAFYGAYTIAMNRVKHRTPQP